ncbi:coiled-coil domain-containing protein [Rhodanobacter hydrolyticus]|uniref:DUF1351 domain-containing protein n=1 Tax=Rhodanobacter hydrolyticus TaxID=2250595 RepID=A0ABW8J3T7_9GAMM
MDTSTTKDAGSNLTQVAEYTQTAAALAELRQKYTGLVIDVTTPKGMKEAKACTFELRTLRTNLEKRRAELKAPILARGKLLDDEAKRITAEIRAMEEPIDVQIKAEEARAEAEKLAKLEAERQRVEGIARAIEEIRNVPGSLFGKPAVIVEGQLAKLRAQTLDIEFYAERFREAEDALAATIARVEQQLAAQREQEAEQKRMAAERAELERMRAENERLQREADERRRADEARAAAERAEAERQAQAERDRLAAEERDREEAERAERQRQEAEARAAREALERAEREAREAELAAERERQAEEQRRLEAERAELERQRRAAAAKAERERLANLGLREAASAVLSWLTVNGHSQQQVTKDLMAALENDAAQVKPVRGKRSAAA